MDSVLRTVGQQSWWLFLTQGVLSILFGILLLAWPSETLNILVGLFGLLTVLAGIIGIFAAIGAASSHESWGWQMISSVLGILAGLIILKWPAPTLLVVVLVLGFWAILTGLVGIIGAIVNHAELPHAWLIALSGAVSLLFGVLLLFWPGIGLLTLVYLAGIYAITYGVIACVLAMRVRSIAHRQVAETGGHPAYQ